MESQSEEDNWEPQLSTKPTPTLFNRIQVSYTDQQINEQIEQQLSQPAYYPQPQPEDMEDLPSGQPPSQALYNPLEDDQNQQWMQQRFSLHNSRQSALTCPNCFALLAHQYQCLPDGQYLVQQPSNIVVMETRVIRNRDSPETVDLSQVTEMDQKGRLLQERQEEFNVKIVCGCECGVDVGYWDANRGMYVLINVV